MKYIIIFDKKDMLTVKKQEITVHRNYRDKFKPQPKHFKIAGNNLPKVFFQNINKEHHNVFYTEKMEIQTINNTTTGAVKQFTREQILGLVGYK